MKKIIILSVLIALSATVTSHAQTDTVAGYKSIFGHESTVWNGAINFWDSYGWDNFIMRTSIDTSVNEKEYKKVDVFFYNARNGFESLRHDFLLREDTSTGRVWIRYTNNASDTDILIVDMSMGIGDSILLFRLYGYYYEEWFMVTGIDTINNAKTIHLRDKNNSDDVLDFIEGIGGSHLFDYIQGYSWAAESALVCSHKDGELVYHKAVPHFPDENCIIPYVGIVSGTEESSISVSPNPCSDWIRIEGDNIQSACLYDILGSVIMDNVDVHSPINLSSLPHGVYLLRVANGNTLLTKTIIKI